jgi:ABC-type branched-subunit amino acid transport system substrate-binding protein
MLRWLLGVSVLAVATMALAAVGPAAAQKKYDPGASDTEIKVGNLMPYSGPASAWSVIGQAEGAYLQMVNDQGGINGRKVNFISVDDGYSPPKAVEQARKLVEHDEVLLIFGPVGTPSNIAIRPYMNSKKVPQLFVSSGASAFADPQHFPWTMGWNPSYRTEARIYAKYLLATKPDAKIGILFQNDDFGKDYLAGVKEVLGERAKAMIVSEQAFEVTDASVDTQIITLNSSGADAFINIASSKFAAQAIRKAYDINWHPVQLITNNAISYSVLEAAGTEKSVGLISAGYLRDPNDPRWDNDPAFQDFRAFMAKYQPKASISDGNNLYGYAMAQTLVQVLKQCGDDLTRENVMRQAANLDMPIGVFYPGIRVMTSPTDFSPIKQMQLERFNGKTWREFGEVMQY